MAPAPKFSIAATTGVTFNTVTADPPELKQYLELYKKLLKHTK